MSERILIIEDETAIQSILSELLTDAGYNIEVAGDGLEGITKFREKPFSLVLLDIMMPKIDGYTVCEMIRQESNVPIIMLTALDEEEAQVKAFELKVDDYITKPFSVSELIARLEALTRRIHRGTGAAKPAEEPEQLVSGPFVLDEKSRILYKSGKPIDLTQVEFQIMELFFRNPATALVREKILEGVWGKNYFGDVKIVDVNIRRLRMKIEDEPSNPRHIMTVWGYGYRWNV